MNKKRKQARKMMTPAERAKNISPYDSLNWQMRKQARLNKIIKEHYQAIGHKGGTKTAERGSEYFREIGKLSHKKRAENKQNDKTGNI